MMSDQWQLVHFGWHFCPPTRHLQPPDVSPSPCNRRYRSSMGVFSSPYINRHVFTHLHWNAGHQQTYLHSPGKEYKVTYTHVLIPPAIESRARKTGQQQICLHPLTTEKQVTHKCVFIPLQQKCWSTIDMSPFHCSKKTGHYYVTVPLKQKDSSLADVSWCPCNRKTCHWHVCLRPPSTEWRSTIDTSPFPCNKKTGHQSTYPSTHPSTQ